MKKFQFEGVHLHDPGDNAEYLTYLAAAVKAVGATEFVDTIRRQGQQLNVLCTKELPDAHKEAFRANWNGPVSFYPI